MKIRFLKDHGPYKAGTEVSGHPNEDYLITLKVAEEVTEKKEVKPKPEKKEVKTGNKNEL